MSDPTLSEMLAMAAISYRGFNLIGPASFKLVRLRQALDESFGRFPSVKDKWKVVWGPAACGLSVFGLDDVVVYVAEAVGDPSNLAVVIRGTNPVSLADWIFGDLMFEQMVPWSFGEKVPADAKISASTGLGLAIIRRLAWSTEGAPVNGPVQDKTVSFSETLEGWVKRIGALFLSSLSSEIKNSIARLGDLNFDPIATLGLRHTSGQALKEFLRQRVSAAQDSEIYVTGHSKGGALSSTVALWLADTQGREVSPDESWDPENRATIRCYSFAGPTAGNAAFADYSNARLEDRCHRIWNRMDIVPRAFVSADLRKIPDDYKFSDIIDWPLKKLIDHVADKAEQLGYKQICGSGTALDCSLAEGMIFPTQIAHQHLDGYLEKIGLLKEMSAAILFKPVL